MTKLEKAVEIVRGWSDEEIKKIILKSYLNPCAFPGLEGCEVSGIECMTRTLEDCWNEEV